ncbi:TcpE family conjugal transfer membrane protein [Microbispora sp. KK1-11]|uniref:TcpE family conjugal transfer membrane protein n=1 Tax=Microbispora sp. KK1-11 TaxID=2053005 RepID=UPI00163D15C4|nr:TcpE family conjugal transfer membrane protein [Microbispora sp. KK1-11]
MDLPTYTNIWRIEKRLYKLYDLRLPMPLPVVWIGVFVGVSVPWWVFLYLIGLPFAAPWHVIYLVPPGVLTWLSTRPVIESKRLTELLQSQLRYMSEPRTWCRMAPFDEPDEIALTARVWRTTPPAAAAHARAARKARRAVSVKVPVPKVSRTGGRAASGAGRVGAHQVDPSRVVRPAVAAAAAAAAPVTDTPPTTPSRSGAAARAGATGERVFYLTEPPAPSAPPAPLTRPAEPQTGLVTGPDSEHEPHEGHGGGHDAPQSHESHEQDPVRDSVQDSVQDSVRQAPPAAPAEASEEPAVPPIGTETLRRLRRLAASAEPRAVRPSGVASFTEPATVEPAHEERPRDERAHDAEPGEESADAIHTADTEAEAAPREPADDAGRENTGPENTGRENTAPRDAEALEQHRKGRPPRLVRPRVPGGAWGEPAGEVPAAEQDTEPDEHVPDEHVPAAAAPPADATTEHAPEADASDASDASLQDTPTWIRPSHAPQEVPDDAGPASHPASHPVSHPVREGTHAPEPRPFHVPGSRPYESVTGKGDVTPPPAGPAGVSIRAVPAGPRAAGPAGPARPSLPTPGTTAPGRPAHEEPPRLRRVEAVVGRDTSGGWRRLAQVVVGGSRTDGMEVDEARTRIPLTTSRRIMVLGCTGGAGQTTTALMLGHTLARYREDRVLALDANTGEDTLTTRIAAESPETLSSLIEGSEEVTGYLGMRAYTTRCESGLEVVGADTDDRVTQRLAERAFLADWRRTLAALDRHYRLTVIDPAAALAARLLPYADQLVLVAPASEDASEAVAMTYEWLDGHGCSDLRRRAVMVINGVSRRSLPDVEQAEAVASGRCRAIVRVPWEDELAPGRPGPVDVNHLRMGGRRAYVALAGVIVSGLAAVQAKQEVAR